MTDPYREATTTVEKKENVWQRLLLLAMLSLPIAVLVVLLIELPFRVSSVIVVFHLFSVGMACMFIDVGYNRPGWRFVSLRASWLELFLVCLAAKYAWNGVRKFWSWLKYGDQT